MMISRTIAVMRKEFIHIVRDPGTLVLIFLIPIIQMVLLGYAARTDVDNIALAVLDADHSNASRNLVNAYEATSYFRVANYVDSQLELEGLLDRGDARAGLIIPIDYSQNLQAGYLAQVGFVIDGSDPTVASSAMAAALQTGQAQAIKLNVGFRRRGLEVRPTVWYNPGLESVNYMIPALMGLILQFLATLVTSMAIVRERERGTMEQLIVTPIRPMELIVGKTVPYIALSLFDFIEVLLIGVLWFGVPIHGSVWLLLGLSGLFLLGALGIGILISTAAHTQQEAMLMSFLFLMPSIFLSGFFFPLEAMPRLLQLMSYVVPLRYMLIIVRGIVLKGIGMGPLQSEVLILSIFCMVILIMAARRFRKSLD
jgi:ABC-2 type transport system permease protein